MDILGFLTAHQAQLIALIVASVGITTAKKVIPKMRHKERGSHARWASFIIYFLSGVILSVAMIPFFRWLIGLAASHNLGGQIVGNLTAVASLALGWHAVAMLVSVIRDLADKTPDHEARTGALWIPTFLPIGIASVMALVKNPSGVGQGLAAAAIGVITLIYAAMIAKRADAASDHKNKWNWFVFVVYLLAGLVIIPMFSYANGSLISMLPAAMATLLRVFIGITGIGLLIAGVADIWVDRVPDAFARAGARFGIGMTAVFGGLALAAIGHGLATGFSTMF